MIYKHQPTTPLEQQMSQLLRGSKHVQKEDEVGPIRFLL